MVTKCYLIYIQTFIFNEIEQLTLAVAHGVKFASGLAFPCVANIDIQIIGLKSMQAIFNYPMIVLLFLTGGGQTYAEYVCVCVNDSQ